MRRSVSKTMHSLALACILGTWQAILPAVAQQDVSALQSAPLRTGAPNLQPAPTHTAPIPPGMVRQLPIAIGKLSRLPRVVAYPVSVTPPRDHPLLIGTGTDPVLFSSLLNYTGNATPNHVDPLWLFPTTGYNPANSPVSMMAFPNTQEVVPNWSQSTPAGGTQIPGTTIPVTGGTITNFYTTAFGQTGESDQITELFASGGLFDLSEGVTLAGTIQITIYDGATTSTPPSDTGVAGSGGIAMTVGGHQAIYKIPLTATTGSFGVHDFVLADPAVLSNATGKFGVRIAKITDNSNPSPSTTQWFMFAGFPNGPNSLYLDQLNGTTASSTYVGLGYDGETCTSDGYFSQSFQSGQDPNPKDTTQPSNTFPVNYGLELHGKTAAGVATSRGTLQGNIRMQGVYVPQNPVTTTQTVEYAPGSYNVALYQGSTLVTQQRIFTQPSFNANGTLTINYIFPGIPAGTYTVSIQQALVYYFPGSYPTSPPVFGDGRYGGSDWANAEVQYDSTTTQYYIPYPYCDWYTDSISSVTIAGSTSLTSPATPTTLNARLTRFGDFTDNGTYNEPDGVVDSNDFALLTTTYLLSSGDPGYLSICDMVGPLVQAGTFTDGTPYYDDLPNGTVDSNTVTAFTVMFLTGGLEPYYWADYPPPVDSIFR